MHHNHPLFAKSAKYDASGKPAQYGQGLRQAHIDYVIEHGNPVCRNGEIWYVLRWRDVRHADRWLYRKAVGTRARVDASMQALVVELEGSQNQGGER